ncbi:MAG: ATP-binding protein [Bacilli bacterium]|nr:ATP-binding protein [Bacilli bacterium]
MKNKFQKVSMPHEDLIKIQDKLITHYSYISKGKVSENGGSGLYLKLFSDEMLEKKFDSEIKKIQNELVNETYPNFYNLIDDVDVDFDSINFTYRDLIESRNDAFFRVIDFLNAFTKNSDEQADILNKLIFLKQPRQTNLSKEDSQRIEKEIKSTKSYVENVINKNIDNIFSVFTNLHCKLQISLSQNNDILCNIYQTPGKTIGAITVDLQGSGIKKIVKLIYLLQICKSQDKQKHIILVDEIENCLSINTQLALLKYLKKYVSENNNVYIVCVTHAPSFFTKLKNEKYDDYLMLNICSSLGDGSIGLETVSADEVISLDTGYELANGEDLQNGVAFLAKVLEMPLELAKKIKE